QNVRCKTGTLSCHPSSVSDLPQWSFDGSSTSQAQGHDSDVLLKPVNFYRDPFFLGNSILVCETYAKDGTPHTTNKRYSCDRIMERVMDEENSEFVIEQEYTLLDYDGHPFCWPKSAYPGQQGPYYCAVGATNVYGRQISEAHYKGCL
ncbi:Glutamine synthetase, partial [Geodia barretti]